MNVREILADFGDMPICGRCLVVINASVSVRAKHPNGALALCAEPTNTPYLKAWVIDKHLDDRLWWFEIGPTTDRFIPFATMYGDPVCGYDLVMLAELERRRYR